MPAPDPLYINKKQRCTLSKGPKQPTPTQRVRAVLCSTYVHERQTWTTGTGKWVGGGRAAGRGGEGAIIPRRQNNEILCWRGRSNLHNKTCDVHHKCAPHSPRTLAKAFSYLAKHSRRFLLPDERDVDGLRDGPHGCGRLQRRLHT